MANKFLNYIKDTRVEMKKVNWLSRKEVINFTIVVIVVSIGVSAVLGAFDAVFSKVISVLIK